MAKTDDQTPDAYLYDVRLIERHIAQGRITRQEVDKRLAACPDVADQVETVDMGRLGSPAGRAPRG